MIDNFFWDKDNKCVRWSNNGKDFEVNLENMYYACLDIQKKYMFVEAGKNYSQDQVYYLSFDGNKIFAFDKLTGLVSWQSPIILLLYVMGMSMVEVTGIS